MSICLERIIKVVYLVLGIMVLLTIVAFFLAENGKINSFPTYFAGLLFIVLLMMDRGLVRHLDPLLLYGTVGLLGYLGFSALWSTNGNMTSLFLHLGYAVLIISFVYGILFLHIRHPEFIRLLLWTTVLAATVSVCLSIQLHYAYMELQPQQENRLIAMGRLNNPVVSALSYGMATVLAFYLMIQSRDVRARLLCGFCIIALFTGVVLTGTRSVWVGMSAVALYGIWVYFPGNFQRKLMASMALLVVIGGVGFMGWDELIKRSSSFRPEIWRGLAGQTLSANWLFGNGIATDSAFRYEVLEFDHAHSIYVSTFFYGGLTGLLALLGYLGFCAARLWRAQPSGLQVVASMMLLFGVAVLAFDGDRILTKVDYLWIVFWLPIALVLVADSDYRAQSPRQISGS